jgi:hypothetical protein
MKKISMTGLVTPRREWRRLLSRVVRKWRGDRRVSGGGCLPK